MQKYGHVGDTIEKLWFPTYSNHIDLGDNEGSHIQLMHMFSQLGLQSYFTEQN